MLEQIQTGFYHRWMIHGWKHMNPDVILPEGTEVREGVVRVIAFVYAKQKIIGNKWYLLHFAR
jgi:hypothetical protein